MSADDEWLDRANPVDLEVLAGALIDGRLVAPFSAGSVRMLGLDESLAGRFRALRESGRLRRMA